MRYDTTSYQIDAPTPVWKAFKQIHDDRDRINAPIVELMAENVADRIDELDPELQTEVEDILGGGGRA